MYYSDIFKAFYENDVQYLLCGGLAVNLHNVPRVTQDIDVIISMDTDNIRKINQILKTLDYLPRLPVDPENLTNAAMVKHWMEQKNLKAFSFYNKRLNYKVIDIVLVHPLNFDQAWNNKKTFTVDDFRIYTVSLDDLIVMKRYSGRAQDLSDANLLERIKSFKEHTHES